MFNTHRITLRKMTADDTELYHIWRNDPDVMQSTSPSLDLHTEEETKSFVKDVLLSSSSSKCYMIEDKETSQTIGITSLVQIDLGNRNAECIIDIGEKGYWGKGYGREALGLLLDYAFLELNLHRIALRVFSFNEKAISLYCSIGFTEEGISRESLFRNGQWHDIIQMGFLQNEYIAMKKEQR
ncbi:GNAT family N-acetyltransferase [Alteribacter lacisalsi]|uniref:GNAT family N-acetyltransferase n=1 Tax=Alteribacter lacisalsi TaxID=2045244 RepID=A0A2W0HS82_9BACI|nr:GNAT family protein [Alteribacter lacisalsi]PYZ96428.1 GNAT family N-acetyltransferase [Alteribacter lacisalsi]